MTDGNGLSAGQDNCRGVRQTDQKRKADRLGTWNVFGLVRSFLI